MLWAKNLSIQEVEKVQLEYLKNVLGVRRQTPTLAVYAETGRFPLLIRQKMSTINYWARICCLLEYDILHKCLTIQNNMHSKGVNCWFSKVVNIMKSCDTLNWEVEDPQTVVSKLKIHLYTNEQTRILDAIQNTASQPKLRTYKLFKSNYCIEPYLTLNLPNKLYKSIARFRTSSHNLRIETGRHESPKLPLEERICNKCDRNEIEDELHCMLLCSHNNQHRTKLLNIASNYIPDIHNLDSRDKFIALMCNKQPEIIVALGHFLSSSFQESA